MNIKNILFSISLFAIFLATSILAISTAKKLSITHKHSTDNPDFFMTNATYTKFNIKGNISDKIKAEKITHFATDNTYLFEQPNIIFHKKNEQPWHITANHGKSKKGKTKIYLWGDTKIIRNKGKNNSDFDVATENLTIYPDTNFAETKEPVTIIQSGNITKAVGAEIDFKKGVLKLLSQVKGLYQAE